MLVNQHRNRIGEQQKCWSLFYFKGYGGDGGRMAIFVRKRVFF